MESAKAARSMIQRMVYVDAVREIIALAVVLIAGMVSPVLAQGEFDPVRDNMALPQVGLSILTSLSAVAGAVLKGELRAESSHKDILLLLHALANGEFKVFTYEDHSAFGEADFWGAQSGVQLASSSVYKFSEDTRTGITSKEKAQKMATNSLLWRLAVWLDTKGYCKCLKHWCAVPVSKRSQACMIVESSRGATLLQRMILSWFRFNCEHTVRLVTASHPQDCGACLEIPGHAWPGVLDFMPRPWWSDIRLGDENVRLNCTSHGGDSTLSQSLMVAMMERTDYRRLAIVLPKGEEFWKKCLPKAYCSLDAVERNGMTPMAKFLVEDKEMVNEYESGPMYWSAVRRAVACVMEISVALLLCWAAQMPPLSASLVGRRLVRSHATGAWGNSSLVIGAGNYSQVIMQSSRRISIFDVCTTLTNCFTLIASLESALVLIAVVVEYACWTLVLVGVLPAIFGATPKSRWHLAKACAASALLSFCFLLCIRKNFYKIGFPIKAEFSQVFTILCLYVLSQVVIWCICVFTMGRLRVAMISVCCAGFGELMWLAAMWAGAHNSDMEEDRISWERTAAHVAPYFTDAGAALLLAF